MLALAHGDKSEDSLSKADASVTLHTNTDFKSFVSSIEALDKVPLESEKIVQTLAGHVHPAGLIFLVHGTSSHKVLKSMTSVRVPSPEGSPASFGVSVGLLSSAGKIVTGDRPEGRYLR